MKKRETILDIENRVREEAMRDEFAMSALNGMISSAPVVDRTKVNKRVWAKVAYDFAEAMLKECKARS